MQEYFDITNALCAEMMDSKTNYSERKKEETNISSKDSEEICTIEGDGIDFEYVGPHFHEPDTSVPMIRA